MADLAVALGLVLVLEGALYAGAPIFAKRLAAIAVQTPENQLRAAGLVAIAVGFGIVWLVRTLS